MTEDPNDLYTSQARSPLISVLVALAAMGILGMFGLTLWSQAAHRETRPSSVDIHQGDPISNIFSRVR